MDLTTIARLVVLSGPLCAGKTSIAVLLEARQGFVVVRARQVLRELSGGVAASRGLLQALGREIEDRTGGAWLGDAVRRTETDQGLPIVVDAVRTPRQREVLRSLYPELVSVHLTATREELRRRFESRQGSLAGEFVLFDDAMSHPTEIDAELLRDGANFVIDTTALSLDEAYEVISIQVATGA